MSTLWPDDKSEMPPVESPQPAVSSEPLVPFTAAVSFLTAMWGCVVAAAITAGMAGWTDWQPGLLLPLLLFTFVAGFYRWVWLHDRLQVQDKDYSWAVSVAELVLLVLVARLASYASNFGQLNSDLAAIPTEPFRLLYGQFILYLISMLLAWYFGREGAKNVGKLYLRPHELQAKGVGREAMLFDGDRRDAFKSINNTWRAGAGIIGVLAVFGLFFKNQTENVGPLDLRSQMLTLTTLYFIVGLLWNGWGRMRYLRTTWQGRKLTEPPQLMSRWSRYLIVLLLVAAVPAIIIPGGYSINPLAWLDWLFSLFKTGQQGRLSNGPARPLFNATELPTPTPVPPPPPSPPPAIDLSWLPLVFFWIVTVVLLVYALRVLAQTGLGRFKLPTFFLTRWLAAGWKFLLSFFRFKLRFDHPVAAEGEEFINTDEQANFFDFLRPERAPTDPRARVRYYYKKLLRKGAKNGLARSKGMTPEEYFRYLQTELAEPIQATPDLGSLTTSFEEARYSQHSISEEVARQAGESWQRLEPQLHKPPPAPPPPPVTP